MSELTLKLILSLIPGAISTLIYGKMILHKEWNNFRFVLYSILFGVFSYLVLQTVIEIINLFKNCNVSDLTIWDNLSTSSSIPYNDVILSTITSIILAFIMSIIENKKVINKIGQKAGISHKYGDENLFSRFLNSSEIEYVYLRVPESKLTYHGWVKSFSESDSVSEIRLGDVSVHNYDDSELLYEIDEIYLSFKKQNIIIELAKNIKKK